MIKNVLFIPNLLFFFSICTLQLPTIITSFSALRDLQGPSSVKPSTPSPHALSPPIKDPVAFYVLKEKLFSVSGEDFNVLENGKRVFTVTGSNKVPFGVGGLILDKLEIKNAEGKKMCSVERRAIALKTAYDVYSPDGKSCICKIEEEVLPTLTPTFKFFYEPENNPKPFLKAVGSFSSCNYDVYARDGSVVVAISRSFVELSDKNDCYGIRMAKGVDPAAIVALACVIDEVHDEEKDSKEKKRKKK